MNGQPRIVRPHPNFRIFLTMDPSYGEVSRAMRNRCVEIALPHPTHLPARLLSEVIDCSHVVDTRIRDLMTRVHVEITERIKTTKERLSRGESAQELQWDPLSVTTPLPRCLVTWSVQFARQVAMGTNLGLALRCTFDQAYFAQVGVFTNADFEQMYVDFPLFKSTGADDAGEMTLGQRIGILFHASQHVELPATCPLF